MLDFVIVTYILGVVFFGGLCAITLWRTGGFQGFANVFNTLGAGEISSNYVQWMVVAMSVGWFITIPAILVVLGIAKVLTRE